VYVLRQKGKECNGGQVWRYPSGLQSCKVHWVEELCRRGDVDQVQLVRSSTDQRRQSADPTHRNPPRTVLLSIQYRELPTGDEVNLYHRPIGFHVEEDVRRIINSEGASATRKRSVERRVGAVSHLDAAVV